MKLEYILSCTFKMPVKLTIRIITFQKVDELQQQMILEGERLHSRMNIMEEHVSEVGKFIIMVMTQEPRGKSITYNHRKKTKRA